MKLAEVIKPNIESLLCPAHDIHPIVDALGDELHIHCCCNKFHLQCLRQVELMLRQMDYTLNNLTVV